MIIKKSVGKGGRNRPEDVLLIQNLLKKKQYFHGDLSGENDSTLEDSINRFQKDIGIKKPDSRIDSGGFTLRKLQNKSSKAEPIIFVQLARTTRQMRKIRYTVEFPSPRNGSYNLTYCQVPLFSDSVFGRLGSHNRVDLNHNHLRKIKYHLRLHKSRMEKLGRIDIRDKPITPPITIYLRVNDKVPVWGKLLKGGVFEEPVSFSWWIRSSPFVKNIYYRYRLYPDDIEWSPWQKYLKAKYYFISKGQHEFRLEGKYEDNFLNEHKIPQVSYNFTITEPFIAKPEIKAGIRSAPIPYPPAKIYSKSRALLIGVNKFNDKRSFKKLPYVKSDLDKLETVLKNNDFEINRLEGNITLENVLHSIDRLISRSDNDDRIIIYFSSHGFQDPIVSSEAYIATTNCQMDSPTINCLSLNKLDSLIRRGIQKPLKHILVIVDSCFSGLGVITKNVKYPDIVKIATKPGAHMLTAGMAEQEAQMDHELGMSTFTHYLVEGLSGKADYTEDKIITVSELLLYVQYEVADRTNSAQIPMLGKIIGQGEMVFDLRQNK